MTLTHLNRQLPRSGFTLIELVVVIVIIALMAAVLAVGLPPSDQRVLEREKQVFLRALAQTRTCALKQLAPCSLTLVGTQQQGFTGYELHAPKPPEVNLFHYKNAPGFGSSSPMGGSAANQAGSGGGFEDRSKSGLAGLSEREQDQRVAAKTWQLPPDYFVELGETNQVVFLDNGLTQGAAVRLSTQDSSLSFEFDSLGAEVKPEAPL